MTKIKRLHIRQINPYLVGENGVRRISRARHIDLASLSNHTFDTISKKPKHKRKLDTAQNYVACVLLAKNGQLGNEDQELLYVAHALSEGLDSCAVLAVVFGHVDQGLGDWGADQVIEIDYDILQHYQIDAMVKSLQSILEKFSPEHLLIADDSWGGGDLIRRLAAKLGDHEFAGDTIEIDANTLIRQTDNGKCDASRELPLLIGIKSGISESELDLECELMDHVTEEIPQVAHSEVYKMPASTVPLEQAGLVMSLGNGVSDTDIFMACAEALGATVGGSRVVVDDGKLTRDRQIGATGKSTAASAYLAFGISGAVQHLEGIKKCKTVIAINTDDSCAMVSRADYSYINDAVEVMKELSTLAKQKQHESVA